MSRTCPICNSIANDAAPSCPACGFKFNGSTESFAPLQLTGANRPVQSAAPRKPGCLKVVRGPRTGAVIDLYDGELSIGRDPRCDVFLNDMTVSRNHATLTVKGASATIRDNNSFNGVWVNNSSVDVATLTVGDKIQIGEFCLHYCEAQ